MNLKKITVNAFCVIGKVGSSDGEPDVALRLWKDANEHFHEVEALAKKDADGLPVGFWGAMTREDMSFLPWEDDYSRGLYMAGVEAKEDAAAPEGWKKWIVPGFECFKVKVEDENTFRKTISYMEENNIELTAAVQDFSDPKTGENYMLFPIALNDSKKEMIERIKEKTNPVAFCGLNCEHCFLSQWCGNCRSACNVCSYATLSDDNICENAKCACEKELEGCYNCPELTACKKGFFKEPPGSLAKACSRFIGKYGIKEYCRVMNENNIELKDENGEDANLKILEELSVKGEKE